MGIDEMGFETAIPLRLRAVMALVFFPGIALAGCLFVTGMLLAVFLPVIVRGRTYIIFAWIGPITAGICLSIVCMCAMLSIGGCYEHRERKRLKEAERDAALASLESDAPFEV